MYIACNCFCVHLPKNNYARYCVLQLPFSSPTHAPPPKKKQKKGAKECLQRRMSIT